MKDRLRTLSQGLAAAAVALTVLTGALAAGIASAFYLTQPAAPSLDTSPSPTPTLPPGVSSSDYEAFQLFWEVWALLDANFYGELPAQDEAGYAATHGMLATFGDEHTTLIEPEMARILAEDSTGAFEGIGAYVALNEEGFVLISDVFEGGPAEAAGLQPGDRLMAVDSVPLAGMTLDAAISLIRGPSGSQVALLVSREGVPGTLEVVVTRARLEIPLVEQELREDGIAYVRLYEFSEPSVERMESALGELLAGEPTGLVFDLRGNPGGWLDQAIGVADLFLSEGIIVTERWYDGHEVSEEAGPGELGEDVPLIVLVNGLSASAAEIVAGALQDNGRAFLVGTDTYGKGSVQTIYHLGDGSELRVTSARWLTPDGTAIPEEGISPDILVPWPADAAPNVDPQLERAVEYLLEGS
jgi:carboxyl-terminal processing protease